MKIDRILALAATLVLLAAGGWFGFIILDSWQRVRGENVVRCKVQMNSVLDALRSYQAAYNSFPTGTQSAIVQCLTGNNPQQIHFLYVGTPLERDGQFRDPWETPYRITFESTNRITIRSAGENRLFGDKDDLELSEADGQ